ncbi:MAG: ornithine carbamoyltransferase [Selenomonadales bacterium]|nr:ornithine carbamoyltransferase [Selenomonadales bacterium]MBQ5745534.1 ornithine carbamoyltransferase [Selenomonadales bacterium]MBQ5833165.1 ornithine carbamoyltransferase [Selenomonadales bacterium]MBQ5860164.1 ornithine carbamoyltransferase [Selenomonadales bacterium]
MSFKGRDFLSLHDFTTEEIYQILDLAAELKEKQKKGETHHILKGKTLGMIFEKSSTRTRVSFEVGMYQLGGSALFLSNRDLQIGRGEPIRDTARVLSRYLDGIMIRTFEGAKVEELADFASIPVINALTDEEHPCQVLADLQTIREHKGELKGLKMVYIGDGNNMVNSLMHGCAKVGMDISVATPAGYEPMESMVAEAMEDAKAFGSKVEITQDILAAAKDADVVYTDVWASMGQEGEAEKRQKAFKDYQVNAAVMAVAKPDAIVLHCLPAHRGEEITDEVIESKQSVVFDEAENRLHAQKAVMALVMAD